MSYNNIVQQGLQDNNYTVNGKPIDFSKLTFKNVTNPHDSMSPFNIFCYGYKCRDGTFGTPDTLVNLQNQPLFYPVAEQPIAEQLIAEQPIAEQLTYGGRRRNSEKNQENGGSLVGTLATPGLLLVANEVYKRKISNKSKTPKRGGSVLAKLAAPGVLLVANEIYKRKSTRKNQTPKRGGSALGTLAAPGVLLVANELYKRKSSKTFKNKSRKFSKTRKYGRK